MLTAVRPSRLLVVGDEYYASLAAVRGLRSGGYEPWLATITDDSLAARSRAVAGTRRVAHPSLGADEFLGGLGDVVRELAVAGVLPGNEPALAALAGRDVGAPNGAPTSELVARATDKHTLAELAASVDLPSPASTVVQRRSEEVPDVPFPAIVKPVRSTVTRSGQTIDLPVARLVHTRPELERTLSELPAGDFLVQEFVPGPLGALAGVAWEGRTICVSQQIATRIYPPHVGASAYAETVPVDGRLRTAAEDLIRRLEWSGIWELQFIASPTGPRLIDFNPRFYGSLALAISAGLNLPAIWADVLLGRDPRIGTYRPGVRFRAETREARWLLAELRSGNVAGVLAAVRPHRHTTHAVLSWRDPRPVLGIWARGFGRAGVGASESTSP